MRRKTKRKLTLLSADAIEILYQEHGLSRAVADYKRTKKLAAMIDCELDSIRKMA